MRTHFHMNDPGYGIEWVIPELFATSPLRVSNPEEANVFVVPHLMVAYFHYYMFHKGSKNAADEAANPYFAGLMSYIRHAGPWFDRHEGRDHVFVFAHDCGACMLNGTNIAAVRNSIFLMNMGSLTTGAESLCFNRTKDVIVPPVQLSSDFLDFRKDTLRPDLSTRRNLAHFRGTVWDDLAYSGGVRQALKKLFLETRPGDFLFNEGFADPATYLKELRDSYFCLHPPGWLPCKWSGRFINLLFSGCIPTLLMDDLVFPLEEIIEYDSFSVRIAEADVHNDRWLDILRLVPETVRQTKLQAVWDTTFRFSYNVPTRSGDAFSSILELVARRLRAQGLLRAQQ
eukprot:GILK01019202.1.p1 GENE.GILK01019202.1~~GILK01019202.1.p1  ORF type:complete len:342 (-),score=31.06 GILK01019202.1:110-1135(-)